MNPLIKKLNLDYVSSEVKEFTDKLRSTDFKLFHFNRYISSKDAIREMERGGYEPANGEELLTWAVDNWKKESAVALGEVRRLNGYRRVLYLWDDGLRRGLNLIWFDDDWHDYCRFLAVRKSLEKFDSFGSSDPSILGRLEALEKFKEKVEQILRIPDNESD